MNDVTPKHEFTSRQLALIHLFFSGRKVACYENDVDGWGATFVGISAEGVVTLRADEQAMRAWNRKPVENQPMEKIHLPFMDQPYHSLEEAIGLIFEMGDK